MKRLAAARAAMLAEWQRLRAEGWTHAAIAKRYGLPRTTVTTTLNRFLRKQA
jgi:DNA-directed RNA polymerase specialized sigma24 family protein